MAYAVVPGPMGADTRQALRDPGTLCAGCSACPGPVGMDGTSAGGALVRTPVALSTHASATTPQDGERPLTPGEVAMAHKLFRDSLDYTRVKVHNHEFLPFGLQPDDTAMTPNGEMYFNPRRFSEDFSSEPDHLRHWFIHEMVHVWQHQLGYLVWLRGAIRIGVGYEYVLESGKALGDYNMEAQGDLLADYFALKHLNAPEVMAQGRYASDLKLFEEVLNAFLRNPGDKTNLP